LQGGQQVRASLQQEKAHSSKELIPVPCAKNRSVRDCQPNLSPEIMLRKMYLLSAEKIQAAPKHPPPPPPPPPKKEEEKKKKEKKKRKREKQHPTKNWLHFIKRSNARRGCRRTRIFFIKCLTRTHIQSPKFEKAVKTPPLRRFGVGTQTEAASEESVAIHSTSAVYETQ